MNEIYGNIFEIVDTGDFESLGVTTNGIIKKNGLAVMGAGIALECNNRYRGISLALGNNIKLFGNHVHFLGNYSQIEILSFPTKNHWRDNSDINLIKRSSMELVNKLDECRIGSILLPRPGCGNGGLLWENVKPEIEHILDDRVFIVSY